ncbi:MAG: N-6 DNA methylase, partial [Euryarchaeota archaeon]|nr:N-6 DNA methylase [Euryarchaeota archaeon]MBU4144394.1 Eco57I restriction-modification methylase domain-containing protein [Candidatus Thermoplasmatota archaeon]
MESILTGVMYIGGQARFIMDIPNYLKNEGMLEYALRMADEYSNIYELNIRKPKGQFFTPKSVSAYMANYFTIESNSINLLDPGSGTGILTAAFCERLLTMNRLIEISIDVYENDSDILPYLDKVLKLCKITLEKNGHSMKYNIFQNDFIIHNGNHFSDASLTAKKNSKLYDYIISNPPYYKLNKNSPESIVMEELVSGQPNIYSFFMALSTKILRPGGEMVFITPRSFCSGLYYSKFRKWFLNHMELSNIHIFESRKE